MDFDELRRNASKLDEITHLLGKELGDATLQILYGLLEKPEAKASTNWLKEITESLDKFCEVLQNDIEHHEKDITFLKKCLEDGHKQFEEIKTVENHLKHILIEKNILLLDIQEPPSNVQSIVHVEDPNEMDQET